MLCQRWGCLYLMLSLYHSFFLCYTPCLVGYVGSVSHLDSDCCTFSWENVINLVLSGRKPGSRGLCWKWGAGALTEKTKQSNNKKQGQLLSNCGDQGCVTSGWPGHSGEGFLVCVTRPVSNWHKLAVIGTVSSIEAMWPCQSGKELSVTCTLNIYIQKKMCIKSDKARKS